MQILYYLYQPKQRLYAHVLEHCIHNIIKHNYGAKVFSAKTGLGYSEIVFSGGEKIKNIDDIFEKLNKNLFNKHKKLVLSESLHKKRNYFTMTELMENDCDSISKLDKIKKEFYNLSYKKFIIFCKKEFKLLLVKNLQDIKKIPIRSDSLNLLLNKNISPNKKLDWLSKIEYGWLIPVKNVAEAIVLSWFYKDFLQSTEKKLYNDGVSYDTNGMLYKPIGNCFFINLSIITDNVIPLKLNPTLSKSDFLKKQKELERSSKKIKKLDLVESFYQKMDWNNYMTNEEILSYIKKTPYSKWCTMFSEKASKQKISMIIS